MPVPRWKPQANTEPAPEAAPVNTYRTILTSQGLTSLGTAMADVIRLPGIPDNLEVHILDNAAIIAITDEQRRDPREITIPAGTSTDTLPRDRLVRGRNETAGLVARIQVIARWL